MVRTREKPHLNLRRAVAHHPAHRIAVVSVSRETLHHVRRLRKLNVPPHNLAACVTRPGPPVEITGAELPGFPTWHFRPSYPPRHRLGSGGRGRTSASAPAAVINMAGVLGRAREYWSEIRCRGRTAYPGARRAG